MEYLLSIAGFDPTSGAGVIRDIITFRKLGFYGLGVATALTYQNIRGFEGFKVLSPNVVEQGLKAIMEDFPIKFVKVGMLGASVDLIVELAREYDWFLIFDPLLTAKNGKSINKIEDIEPLLKIAEVITPNVPEAEKLAGIKIKNESDVIAVGKILTHKYGKYVIIKGGHLNGRDYLFGDEIKSYGMPKINKIVHGTGCAYSSSLLSFIAKGLKIEEAFIEARKFLQREIENAIDTGGYSLLP